MMASYQRIRNDGVLLMVLLGDDGVTVTIVSKDGETVEA